ncbi:MAG: YtxH domain-containing protein [Sandaracinaceae bacterium]|nr:YtxH domain-containing protein [Sandaracinaceae bacterium]
MGLRLALFVAIGASLGYAYYRFVGCRSGTCLITGNPYVATLYGAVMGFLLANTR